MISRRKLPNIVMTMADDQRGSALGCAGIEPVITPNLDALVARGVRFSQAQHLGSCHGAVCAPSRAMLLTGIPYFQLDDALLSAPYPPTDRTVEIPKTLGQKLRGAGFHTFATGKWHNGVESFHRSFDSGANLFFGGMTDHWFTGVHDFDPSGQYPQTAQRLAHGFSTEVFAQSAIDFIRSRKDNDQPFFCYCAFTAPHDPRTPPDAWRRRYNPSTLPLPANFMPVPSADTGSQSERDELLLGTPRKAREIQRTLAEYYGMISHMDEWIGHIHRTVGEIGELENTLIIHTADHGLAVGQHGLLGKQNLYQHSLNVPLLLAGSGIPSGLVSDALCYQHDLHPTLAELAQAEGGSPVFRSLLPIVPGKGPRRSHIAAAYSDTQRAVRDQRYKLIEYHFGGRHWAELFDLAEDPWETRNLIGELPYRPVIQTLTGELRQWQQEVGDHEWPTKTMLSGLGLD